MGIQLLTIQELAKEPDFITLFGQNYEVLNFDEFGVVEQGELQRMLNRINAFAQGNGSSQERTLLEQSADKIIKKLMPRLPQAVFNQLRPGHKALIIESFTNALNEYKAEVKAQSSAQTEESSKPQLSLLTGEG